MNSKASATAISRHQKKLSCRILLFFLALCAFCTPLSASTASVSNAASPILTWERLEDLLAHRSFKSQEELFQLLAILHDQEKITAFRLEKETIGKLQKNIKTLFPLKGCQAIELRDSQIVFEFSTKQDVTIPNTWLQASLAMPERLVLRLQPAPANGDTASPAALAGQNNTIRFLVEEGYLQVHFSFLLKIFGGKLRDAEGSELVYLINDQAKTSRLQLIELTPLAGDMLTAVAAAEEKEQEKTLWIDIRHPDFPKTRDIGIAEKTVTFLGTEVELLPDGMIRIGGGEPQKNPEAWTWFTKNILLFKEFAQTGKFASRIDYARNFGYHFEERQIVMNMGFQASDTTPDLRTTSR